MRPPVASNGTQTIPPICDMCRRRHFGECKRYSTWCFHCVQEGHFIREFPQLIGAETSVANLATPAPEMSIQRSSGRGFPSRETSAAAEEAVVEVEVVAQGCRKSPALRPEFML